MAARDYYRGDQKTSITPPDLSKFCEYADHIVNARGKKTCFTSVSLDRGRIEMFGEIDYVLLRQKAEGDGHRLIEHDDLIASLQAAAQNEDKGARLKAIQALRYARLRKEALVDWKFDISHIPRKEVITWAYYQVQPYFRKV